MGRGGASVQQPGSGDGERACADRDEAGAATMRQSQGVKHRCRQRGVEVLIAGHDHGVCFAENLEPSRCGDGTVTTSAGLKVLREADTVIVPGYEDLVATPWSRCCPTVCSSTTATSSRPPA